MYMFFFFKQKTAYEMRISDWSSDVCSSDLAMTKVDQIDEDAALARTDGFTPLSAEDEFARLLLRPHFAVTCETLVLAGFDAIERLTAVQQIGRASCRERVCQSV